MSQLRVQPTAGQSLLPGLSGIPSLLLDGGKQGWDACIEFFTATIRNPNTREAYGRAVMRFSIWCDRKGVRLQQLSPFLVAAYIEDLGSKLSKPSVKQHLAAIRVLFDHLVVRQVLPSNPAASVKGPKHIVRKGKTPVLSPEEAKKLLDSIETTAAAGLRDRALIAGMIFSFARIGAMVAMNVGDYYQQGKYAWFRLSEKGGKRHEVPVHHKAREFMDEYRAALGAFADPKSPLFRTVDPEGNITSVRFDRKAALTMVKRRAKKAGLPRSICNHSFRATGITTYLSRGGSLEHAQRIAAHSSPETTKLYDRTKDKITIDEIERIVL